MVRWFAIVLAALSLTSPAVAQSPRVVGEAEEWTVVTASGLRPYSSRSRSSSIEIACDEAMTLDHSAMGISLELGRGSTLASDGRSATFSLRRKARLLPPEPSATSSTALGSNASAQLLDLPFADKGGDGQAAWCASSVVTGLNPDGDGFLAVRTGPGAQYRKIDEIHNGDIVLTCDERGGWVAIVYGSSKKKGWVHRKWLKDLAG